jgi:hypothetical protein
MRSRLMRTISLVQRQNKYIVGNALHIMSHTLCCLWKISSSCHDDEIGVK